MSASKAHGFTLLELMIVVIIVAVLTAIAVPTYFSQVRKSRRSDAISLLNTVVLNEERWRTNCPSYAAFSEDYTVTCPSAGVNFMPAPTSTYYTFALAGVSAAGYTLTATPVGKQALDAQFGTTCGVLTITNGTTQTPTKCFGH
jgi:type IV pilus assembly protein PilE